MCSQAQPTSYDAPAEQMPPLTEGEWEALPGTGMGVDMISPGLALVNAPLCTYAGYRGTELSLGQNVSGWTTNSPHPPDFVNTHPAAVTAPLSQSLAACPICVPHCSGTETDILPGPSTAPANATLSLGQPSAYPIYSPDTGVSLGKASHVAVDVDPPATIPSSSQMIPSAHPVYHSEMDVPPSHYGIGTNASSSCPSVNETLPPSQLAAYPSNHSEISRGTGADLTWLPPAVVHAPLSVPPSADLTDATEIEKPGPPGHDRTGTDIMPVQPPVIDDPLAQLSPPPDPVQQPQSSAFA